MKNKKINKSELLYEILISKGTGILTRKAERMLIQLTVNAMRKTSSKEYDIDYHDYEQTAHLIIFSNWWKFNLNVTDNAFAYYTELHKRAIAEARNEIYSLKGLSREQQKNTRSISLNSSNNGQGLYNV